MNTNAAQSNLRLSAREIEIIRTTARRLLGAHALIRVFGSRARQDEKGGDIDLLVETDERQPNRVDLVMIEVQSGEYLGEDDIVRFDDQYGRGNA